MVAAQILSCVLGLADTVAEPHCVPEKFTVVEVLPTPPKWNLQLVGVGFNQDMEPTIVVRYGKGRTARSSVHEVGDKVWGRYEVVDVGPHSALLQGEHRYYVLKLKNRGARDWAATLREWPRCDHDGVPAPRQR